MNQDRFRAVCHTIVHRLCKFDESNVLESVSLVYSSSVASSLPHTSGGAQQRYSEMLRPSSPNDIDNTISADGCTVSSVLCTIT